MDMVKKAAWLLNSAQTECNRRAASQPLTKPRSKNRTVASRAVFAALFSCLLAVAFAHPGLQVARAETKSAAPLENLVITRASNGEQLEFKVEVARTAYQKALGLMFRRELQPLHGMLFPYTKVDDISMWMKNTYIPLDMLFIKPDGQIHHIAEMTEPLSEKIITSNGPVAGVLEIAGGEAKRLGITTGDVVDYARFAPSN